MITSMEYLSAAELFALTGYVRSGAQAEWLREKRIHHKLVDRRLIVSRLHVQAWLEGRSVIVSLGLNLAGIK